MFETKFCRADLIALAAVLLASILIFVCLSAFSERGGEAVVIFPDGSERRVRLNEDTEIHLEARGVHLTLVVGDGNVRVTESDCPGHDCERRGRISRTGEVIVCAPAGIVIRVEAGGEEVDGYAG